jgi:uncharacterized RmlC-like cupin family protein
MHAPGISAETVGAKRIHLQLVTIPPKGRSKAHLHEHHETAVYILGGELVLWYGENLREELVVHRGEFAYIPAGVPHVAYNPSATEPAAGVVARTYPNDQESAVLLPELDGLR